MLVFSVLNGATNTSSFILPVYLYRTPVPHTHTVDAKTMKTFLVDIAYSVPLCFIPISISDFYLLYLCTCIPTIEPVFCWFTCYCILHCIELVEGGMSSNSTTPCHHTPAPSHTKSSPLLQLSTFNDSNLQPLQPPNTPLHLPLLATCPPHCHAAATP